MVLGSVGLKPRTSAHRIVGVQGKINLLLYQRTEFSRDLYAEGFSISLPQKPSPASKQQVRGSLYFTYSKLIKILESFVTCETPLAPRASNWMTLRS